LVWSLQRYAWVVLAAILACAAVPLIVTAGSSTYQAEALVVAKDLTVNRKALPSLAERLFADGAVASAVAEDLPGAQPASGLVPSRLSVVAAQDSIVLTVQARDPDPETAARMATVAAQTLAKELNGPGAGVGQFAVQQKAAVPSEPVQEISPLLWAAAGALAGLLLGVGLVALISAVRRPVVTSEDVEGAAGVAMLGTVELHMGRRTGYPGPLGVRGIATVSRWLATAPAGRLLLISPPTAVPVRQRIYVMAAVALGTVRAVRLEAPEHLVAAIEEHRTELRNAGRHVVPVDASAEALVLVDGGSSLELVDPAVTNVSAVVVAPRGTPRRRLRALASDYVEGGLFGVVLVDVRSSLRAGAGRRARPPRAAKPPAVGTVAVPEPERA
jgi:capsular polysaccharide biosynthesis protein